MLDNTKTCMHTWPYMSVYACLCAYGCVERERDRKTDRKKERNEITKRKKKESKKNRKN